MFVPECGLLLMWIGTVNNDQGLKNVQWTYLGVACFVGLLIILFLLAPFPEITDADMHHQEHAIAEYNPGPLRKQWTLFLGVWCQFCYVGAQVAVAGYFINFVKETGRSAATASDLLAAAQGIYAANRFIAGFLMMIPAVKPRYMLSLYLSMCCVLALVAALTRGSTSVAFLMLVFVFESCCFATIFTMSLRGLGKHTKRGGSWLVAAISGGTVWPSMTGAVVTARNAHIAMLIPMTGFIVGMVFPIYVNVYQRERMDTHRATEVGLVQPTEKELGLERNASTSEPQPVEIREDGSNLK